MPLKSFNIILAVVAILIANGAALGAENTSAPESAGHVYRSAPHLQQGDIGPDGKIVIFSWTHGYRNLDGRYGMMIWFNKDQKGAKPRYELYIQSTKIIQKTANLSEFLGWLSEIPEGSSIYFYDLCLMSSHLGLDSQVLDKIKSHSAKHGIHILEPGKGGYGICTCPL